MGFKEDNCRLKEGVEAPLSMSTSGLGQSLGRYDAPGVWPAGATITTAEWGLTQGAMVNVQIQNPPGQALPWAKEHSRLQPACCDISPHCSVVQIPFLQTPAVASCLCPPCARLHYTLPWLIHFPPAASNYQPTIPAIYQCPLSCHHPHPSHPHPPALAVLAIGPSA